MNKTNLLCKSNNLAVDYRGFTQWFVCLILTPGCYNLPYLKWCYIWSGVSTKALCICSWETFYASCLGFFWTNISHSCHLKSTDRYNMNQQMYSNSLRYAWDCRTKLSTFKTNLSKCHRCRTVAAGGKLLQHHHPRVQWRWMEPSVFFQESTIMQSPK